MSVHLVLDVPAAERAEHLSRLNGKALASLAAAVDEVEEPRPVSRSWEELLAFTRITSRCLHCSYVLEDVTLEQAGYDQEAADALAGRDDVDLHAAVELVRERGCPPDLACRVLL